MKMKFHIHWTEFSLSTMNTDSNMEHFQPLGFLSERLQLRNGAGLLLIHISNRSAQKAAMLRAEAAALERERPPNRANITARPCRTGLKSLLKGRVFDMCPAPTRRE